MAVASYSMLPLLYLFVSVETKVRRDGQEVSEVDLPTGVEIALRPDRIVLLTEVHRKCKEISEVDAAIKIRVTRASSQDLFDQVLLIRQIEHFFAHYKDLEPGKWVKIIRWGDAAEARAIVQNAIALAKAA